MFRLERSVETLAKAPILSLFWQMWQI